LLCCQDVNAALTRTEIVTSIFSEGTRIETEAGYIPGEGIMIQKLKLAMLSERTLIEIEACSVAKRGMITLQL
jgi:hypothetical protein